MNWICGLREKMRIRANFWLELDALVVLSANIRKGERNYVWLEGDHVGFWAFKFRCQVCTSMYAFSLEERVETEIWKALAWWWWLKWDQVGRKQRERKGSSMGLSLRSSGMDYIMNLQESQRQKTRRMGCPESWVNIKRGVISGISCCLEIRWNDNSKMSIIVSHTVATVG